MPRYRDVPRVEALGVLTAESLHMAVCWRRLRGVVMQLANGNFVVRIRLPCERCHRHIHIVYMSPDETGAYTRALDRNGQQLADFREGVAFVCAECLTALRQEGHHV